LNEELELAISSRDSITLPGLDTPPPAQEITPTAGTIVYTKKLITYGSSTTTKSKRPQTPSLLTTPPLSQKSPDTRASAYDQGKIILLADEPPSKRRRGARGVIATLPGQSQPSRSYIEAGETIMTAPLAYAVLETELLETHCSGCFLNVAERAKKVDRSEAAVKKEFLKCERCQSVVYCSVVSCSVPTGDTADEKRCYAKSAMKHFPECRASPECRIMPSTEVRLLAHILFARAAGKVGWSH